MSLRSRAKHRPAALHALPGATAHCALLTALTILLAATTGWTWQEALLRPLFFAVLYSFFRGIGRRYPHIRSLPMRLVERGFLVLFAGSIGSAAITMGAPDHAGGSWLQVQVVLDRGAWFLLGFVLLAYGLMLWIPLVLESHRTLEASMQETQDRLHQSETTVERMQERLADAHRTTMLGELAAGVAHDLRNPLTIVMGAADALARRHRSAEEVARHTDIIRRGVAKADRTIQALIDLGRPRAARRLDVDLERTATEVLELVQAESRRRSVRITADMQRLTITSDPELLSHILINLLLNAVQVSPHDGRIGLRARVIRTGTTNRIAISISDEGPGLPPHVRQQLFTPFFTTRQGGTGLGLLSCRRFANELGGDLRLYPRNRKGTRALVLLPLDAALASSRNEELLCR